MKVLVINTSIYNKIMENEKKKQNESNFKIRYGYEHNNRLDNLKGRQQFNFMAGNYSLCSTEKVEKFMIDTNNLNDEMSDNSEEQ